MRDPHPTPLPILSTTRGSKRTWSRTDTERWLNDRTQPLLAYLRRSPPGSYRYDNDIHHGPPIRAAGSTLRTHDRAFFDRLHLALAAAPEAARDTLHLDQLLA